MAAIIKLKTGKRVFVPHERGLRAWACLTGEAQNMTPEEIAYTEKVEDIYLDRTKAPLSYLEAHQYIISAMPMNGTYIPKSKLEVVPLLSDVELEELRHP